MNKLPTLLGLFLVGISLNLSSCATNSMLPNGKRSHSSPPTDGAEKSFATTAPTSGASAAAIASPPAAIPSQVTLTVYYIRHGQSCANPNESWNRFSYQDPEMTDCGIFRSLEAGEAFQNYLDKNKVKLDLIGSSRMRRTKESAFLMFFDYFFKEKGILYQLPYIGEIEASTVANSSIENIPYAGDVQAAMIMKDFPQLSSNQIDFSYDTDKNNTTPVDFHKFSNEVLPKIVENLRGADKSGKNIFHIAISAHSNFMAQIAKCTPRHVKKAQYNEVYAESYTFNVVDKDKVVLAGAPSACEPVLALNRDVNILTEDLDRCNRAAIAKHIAPVDKVIGIKSAIVSKKALTAPAPAKDAASAQDASQLNLTTVQFPVLDLASAIESYKKNVSPKCQRQSPLQGPAVPAKSNAVPMTKPQAVPGQPPA